VPLATGALLDGRYVSLSGSSEEEEEEGPRHDDAAYVGSSRDESRDAN